MVIIGSRNLGSRSLGLVSIGLDFYGTSWWLKHLLIVYHVLYKICDLKDIQLIQKMHSYIVTLSCTTDDDATDFGFKELPPGIFPSKKI